MKKGIALLLFCFSCNILTAKWYKKELAKDLRSVLINQRVDLEEGAEDLMFEYKIYKKLIQDSLLDDLIKNTGLEPNEENRMIFFSAISKDLQDHIKKSFSDFTGNGNQSLTKNYPNNATFNGVDPGFYYQAEMTRNFYASLASMGAQFHKSKSASKVYLVLGAALIYFVTKFGLLGKGVKLSYGYMKAKENVDGVSSKTQEVASGIWNKLSHFGRAAVRPFMLVDHSSEHPESEEFFKFYKLFGKVLRDKRDFLPKAKYYTKIHAYYMDGDEEKKVSYPRNPKLDLS